MCGLFLMLKKGDTTHYENSAKNLSKYVMVLFLWRHFKNIFDTMAHSLCEWHETS